jgi:hypothetical protein
MQVMNFFLSHFFFVECRREREIVDANISLTQFTRISTVSIEAIYTYWYRRVSYNRYQYHITLIIIF